MVYSRAICKLSGQRRTTGPQQKQKWRRRSRQLFAWHEKLPSATGTSKRATEVLNHTTDKSYPNRRFHDQQLHRGRRCRPTLFISMTWLPILVISSFYKIIILYLRDSRGKVQCSEHRFPPLSRHRSKKDLNFAL